jgi:tight adherence protein B
MASMGRSSKFIIVIIASVVLAIISGFISTMLGNPFLIPAFVIGALSIPFIFVRTYSYTYQNNLRNELELSLSQITTSYIRTDDIIRAVEENINNMNNPVRDVFQEFVSQVKYINPNIRDGIDIMKDKIDNYVFKEWCDALKKCIQNRTLKYMLMPIVNKFSTLREIQGSIKEALTGYKFEFYIIVGIVYANYPLIYFMEKDWFDVLVNTIQGLACTGLIALITVICFIIFSFIIKPVDYEV